MNRRLHSHPTQFQGFTLMEVMLATAIFSITLAALFVTFRTGIKAWRTSHTTSETFLSAQLAQEVVMSDLTRCFFMSERFYNVTFNTQLQQLENYESVQREASGMEEADRASFTSSLQDPNINPETLAKPVNLKFVGTDGGETDEIEFARHQSPWLARKDYTWGVKRVRYYVAEGVLYREEKEPFGLPSGQTVGDFISSRFSTEDSFDLSNMQQEGSRTTFTEEEMERFEADSPVVEPLCDGVEVFNITYGYHHGGEWVETDSWDSSEFQYRFPEDELESTVSMSGNAPGGNPFQPAAGTETSFGGGGFGVTGQYEQRVAILDGEAVNFLVEQDDLPAYCAIQMAVREPGGENGRLRSFTFFISLAEAQEKLDLTLLESVADSGLSLPGR